MWCPFKNSQSVQSLSHVQLFATPSTVARQASLPMGQEDPWRRDRVPTPVFLGFSGASVGKESACNAGGLNSVPGIGKIPWWRAWQSTPVFLPGEAPWTDEPGGLQSKGSQGVLHD